MSTYNSSNWDEWIRSALSGNKSDYQKLLTNVRGWLIAYYRKRVAEGAVEDLVQDTLLAVHNKRHTYDPKQPFGPWLAAVARYRLIDFYRANAKHTHVELDEDLEETKTVDPTVSMDLKKLLQQISPKQAKVIELLKLREMSVQEVSAQTGYSQSAVKVMAHRGLKKLQALVQ